MPTRSLPRTDDTRSTALNTCNLKWNATANPSDRLITAAQFSTLSLRIPLWTNARDAAAVLLHNQTTATAATTTAFDNLVRYVSHFIQVFNMAIARGTFTPSDRPYYQLDASSDVVPDLKSNADIRLWAARIATGEAARVLAGGAPMAMPTAAQVATAFTAYTSADSTQTSAKTAYDLGQEAVSTQRPTVDALILDLWDTIEYNLRANDPTSLRRKAREWGVTYDNDETEAPVPPIPPVPPVPPTP